MVVGLNVKLVVSGGLAKCGCRFARSCACALQAAASAAARLRDERDQMAEERLKVRVMQLLVSKTPGVFILPACDLLTLLLHYLSCALAYIMAVSAGLVYPTAAFPLQPA